MKSKKMIASVLLLSLSSALLLTSCNNGKQGDKIRRMLEKEYGGEFTLVSVNPQHNAIWPDIDSPFVSYYIYEYEWDEAEGNTFDLVTVSTRTNKYSTNANFVKYYDEFDEYFSKELADWFPGEVVATYVNVHQSQYYTDIEEMDFDDLMYEWPFNLDCIVAVEDPEDHEAIEKALDDIFGEYKIRVECEVVSIYEVDEYVSNVDTSEENKLHLYFNYQDAMPTRECYIYVSDKDAFRGCQTGWYERKAK